MLFTKFACALSSLHAFLRAYYKQLLDEVFVISGIIKVELSVIYGGRYRHYTQIIDGKTYTNLEKNMQT